VPVKTALRIGNVHQDLAVGVAVVALPRGPIAAPTTTPSIASAQNAIRSVGGLRHR
jgi:hypothetical protein